MCGRTVRPGGTELARAIEALGLFGGDTGALVTTDDAMGLPRCYNTCPTDPLAVLGYDLHTRRANLCVVRWGVPRHEGHGVAFNARDDKLRSQKWAPLFRKGRVAIPVVGFHEWNDGERWYLKRADGELMYAAGLVQPGQPPTATIITVGPNADLKGLHDRMPAILERDMIEPWLQTQDLAEAMALVQTASDGVLTKYPVRSKGQGIELTVAVAPQPKQTSLF